MDRITLVNATTPFLSVIVPVYNEEKTLDRLLVRLLLGPYPFPEKEIIVVDDGSTDATGRYLDTWRGVRGLTILRHHRNQGKSSAIRTALAQARGEVTIIQDADLEYDPSDMPRLVELVRCGEASVVYGSRYLRPGARWSRFRVAVVLLNGLVRVLYGQKLSDEATCYKAIRTSLLRQMRLEAERFEFCPEVTAKACRLGCRIVEVPISYCPRCYTAGKKIRPVDGWKAAWTLLRWRFKSIPTVPCDEPSHGLSRHGDDSHAEEALIPTEAQR